MWLEWRSANFYFHDTAAQPVFWLLSPWVGIIKVLLTKTRNDIDMKFGAVTKLEKRNMKT